MNTKNLDAIKRMVVRLQAIVETDGTIDAIYTYWLKYISEVLQNITEEIENGSKQNYSEEIRTD